MGQPISSRGHLRTPRSNKEYQWVIAGTNVSLSIDGADVTLEWLGLNNSTGVFFTGSNCPMEPLKTTHKPQMLPDDSIKVSENSHCEDVMEDLSEEVPCVKNIFGGGDFGTPGSREEYSLGNVGTIDWHF